MTVKHFLRSAAGATSIEYALIASLIFIVIVGAVTVLSGNVANLYGNISNNVSNNTP